MVVPNVTFSPKVSKKEVSFLVWVNLSAWVPESISSHLQELAVKVFPLSPVFQHLVLSIGSFQKAKQAQVSI